MASFSQREIVLRRILSISCPNPDYLLNKCDYSLLVPVSKKGKQEILSTTYSVKPNHMIKTDAGDYFVKWKGLSFSELKNTKLEVEVRLKISKYDLKTAKKAPFVDPADLDTLLFLKDEENFRANSKSIQKAAATIQGSSREEVVKNIFEYVKNNLEYYIFADQDRGARQALKDGKGDCTEYSELMITLCRAKKIPARIVMGLIPKTSGLAGYHNWVEVFFPSYGWVSFDPTWADHENSPSTFDSMLNAYVSLSNQRYITSVNSPCRSDFPFSLRLLDSCYDKSNLMNQKFKSMAAFYNSNQPARAMGLLDTLISFDPTNYIYWMFSGMIQARKSNFEEGFNNLNKALDYSQNSYEKSQALYAVGNYYALKGDKEKAIINLTEAMNYGFLNYVHMEKDEDLKNLKDYPPFIELLNLMKQKYEKLKDK